MTSFSSVNGKQLLLALRQAGFSLIRIKGSHRFIQHTDGRSTVIQIHAGEIIGPGLISKILRDCEMTRGQLQKLL